MLRQSRLWKRLGASEPRVFGILRSEFRPTEDLHVTVIIRQVICMNPNPQMRTGSF